VAPRLLGADRALGLLVLEDLGPSDSLADRLLGADPAAARAGLRAYAATLGRLHAATAGRFGDYRASRPRAAATSTARRSSEAPIAPPGMCARPAGRRGLAHGGRSS
jgi:hypothetical protein